MKFNTAVCILALSLSGLSRASAELRQSKASNEWASRGQISTSLALLAMLIGLATLVQYALNVQLGIDELLVRDFQNSESQLFPGRMSPIAAVCFVLIALSAFCVNQRVRSVISWTTFFALPALFVSMLSLIGYIYAESSLYRVGPFIRISWETAACCFLLSISILLSLPKGDLQILKSPGPGGVMARRLLPVVLLAPIFMGFLWLLGRRNELFDRELGIALFVVAVISIFVLGVTFVARKLDLLEFERKTLFAKEASSQIALAASEMQFRMMANSISQLAWMADKHGRIFWYNQRWYDYTGTAFEEMEGWGWEKVHDPQELNRVVVSWRKSLETGEPWEDKFPLLGKDGRWRWFLSRARPMRDDDGQISFWFGTNTDIDEQLQTERDLIESKEAAEKANMAKTQFLANMSHEIRTPIGAIMGFTDMLRSPSSSDVERATYMNIIERNSQNLLRLIDDILDLSKVEAGKVLLEINPFSLIEFLKDLKSVMALRASEKGIRFSLKFEGLIPDKISADQLRLRQILANLIGNAIKFTDTGQVECVVKYRAPRLQFFVSDTGLGIAPANQKNLFHAFSQADASMTRRFGGTGLGLILSKRLSNALGGDVVLLKSEIGLGSTFVADIEPATVEAAILVNSEALNNPSDAVVLPGENKGRLAQLKVLVVDDAADNRTLVSLYLRKSGAQVSTASDGEEAVKLATALRPDVVLMDIQMPTMDGHSATRKLRSMGFAKPIIALTAHAMREERDKCFESGCTDYLTKPIQKDILIDTLERYMAKS